MPGSKPKYQHIYEELSRDILNGRYSTGQKFPSEAALVRRFGASRITVGHAVRELSQHGLVDRIPGSGTYVRGAGVPAGQNLLFGLIIPDLGKTEIFEPICQGIASSPDATGHALLWAHSGTSGQGEDEQQILELCAQYIERSVSGVFFAPLETGDVAAQVNREAMKRLREAEIPVVLLDRRAEDPADPIRSDLVGIDNHRAGFLAASHLLRLGARRIGFFSHSTQASTVSRRIAGYREALSAAGATPAEELAWDARACEVIPLLEGPWSFDAFVCANDRIAGSLMRALLAQGFQIPKDVRIVGIDDVAWARLLPVPLTTIRQPCRSIGEAALRLMLERLRHPRMPARDVLLDCSLVVRQSCGALPG